MWDGGTEVAFVDYGMLGDGGDYESRCAYTQDIASVVTIAVFLTQDRGGRAVAFAFKATCEKWKKRVL